MARLEEALDEQRFRLYGQRIVPCNGAPSGLHLEVLLRLADRDGTIIAPGAFLPAAERFHIASRLDPCAVREVLVWMGRTTLDPLDLVSVNLSGQSLGDKAFHRDVADLISQTPFDPRKLCFEVTETAAITHLGDAAAFTSAMRELGVRIALLSRNLSKAKTSWPN